MPKITGTVYMDFAPANENCIVQVPMWDGWDFIGFQVVKANWKAPDLFDNAINQRKVDIHV